MSIVILGVDLGKNACSVVGVDAASAVIVRRSMRRQTLIHYVAKLPACVVAMEACCGAHHLARLFAAHGHEIRLMSPEYVRPYVKAQKNDDRNAERIAEAASRLTMRFVELKTQGQLDVQTLHRVRSRLPTIKQIWGDFTARAVKEGWPASRFLAALAEHELAERDRRRIERHLAEAHLSADKTLDCFAFDVVP